MPSYIAIHNLQVSQVLYDFVNDEVLARTHLSPDQFWSGFSAIVADLAPKNKTLLEKRDTIQAKLDKWHIAHRNTDWTLDEYKTFLAKIGYLVPEGRDFKIATENVDDEIAQVAGPQLVVPVMNARFALNATNARWGSLYDAYYGTDVIEDMHGKQSSAAYNPLRGLAVVKKAAEFLDQACPLQHGSHVDAVKYEIHNKQLIILLDDGLQTMLADNQQLKGYLGNDHLSNILLRNNGLHIDIQIDHSSVIGSASASGIKDIVIESALTTIQDCEDSVAAVDADDKVAVYRNWLGLMQGDLEETFVKEGEPVIRKLYHDRIFTSLDDGQLELKGRSLLLVRNVGHLMTNSAVLDESGNEVPEGIIDAMVTTACAIHDFNKNGINANSKHGSIYIVKPKMHGPEEAAFTNELFTRVEDALLLPRNTIKVGVMDEERRTTVNLKECIRAVSKRLVFINTGFLDRTGDEIHTSMHAGPFLPKEDIKKQPWISAYEDWNVDIGLDVGMQGIAQIGKGMWPKPDQMKQMMETKLDHLKAGANCAWIPSPTAATLHATHYHQINVASVQAQLKQRKRANLDHILTIPLLGDATLNAEQIQTELDNNAQGLLGYVVRWVDAGIGCSKVPDINDIGLMEDRATLRISSQHMANWLLHGLCDEDQIMQTMQRMAKVVDQQNLKTSGYQAMADDFENSIAFKAACDLVFKGKEQVNGYTEPLLHEYRLVAKR